MKALNLHRWDITPAEARDLQLRLRERMERTDRLPELRCVAGADVALELPGRRSWETGEGRAVAGIVAYRFPEMQEIERASAVCRLAFPYVPGLLSFREIPALLAAFEQLECCPDLIFCDGQGYAHPRRFGLACHLGVLLDCASIGVAKSILIGDAGEPCKRAGSTAPLVDPDSGEQLGTVIRTATGVKPVYVSQGHRTSLARAVELTLAVRDGYRIPRPTRDADHFVRSLLRGLPARRAAASGRRT
jgi:deoxyribonuclease V